MNNLIGDWAPVKPYSPCKSLFKERVDVNTFPHALSTLERPFDRVQHRILISTLQDSGIDDREKSHCMSQERDTREVYYKKRSTSGLCTDAHPF